MGLSPSERRMGVGTYKYTGGVGKCRGSEPSKDITTCTWPTLHCVKIRVYASGKHDVNMR